MRRILVILIFFCPLLRTEFVQQNAGVVEWFGDQRGGKAEDNFYDVIYDDICSTSIKSNGVANYVFVGTVIKTLFVDNSVECVTECFKETRCKSVNFYPSRRTVSRNVCELNEANQMFNPNSMIRYEGAAYFDNIECEKQRNGINAAKKPMQQKERLESATNDHNTESFFRKSINRLEVDKEILSPLVKQSIS